MRRELHELHAELDTTHWWFRARSRIVRRIANHLLSPSKKNILVDIGCGTGGTISVFLDDYSCIGIDPAGVAIEAASQRYKAATFITDEAPFGLGKTVDVADIYLLLDVLEHIEDDFYFLSSLLAAIKSGSFIVITVPANMALWSEHDVAFSHYRRYDIKRLQQLWENLDVDVLLLSYFNARLYPLVWLVRKLKKTFMKGIDRNRTDMKLPSPLVNRALERIFAGEGKALAKNMKKKQIHCYSRGSSIIAILKRGRKQITPRNRPSSISPDPHHPDSAVAQGAKE